MLSGFLVMVTTILPEMAVMVFFILFVATIVVTLFVGTMSLSFMAVLFQMYLMPLLKQVLDLILQGIGTFKFFT